MKRDMELGVKYSQEHSVHFSEDHSIRLSASPQKCVYLSKEQARGPSIEKEWGLQLSDSPW